MFNVLKNVAARLGSSGWKGLVFAASLTLFLIPGQAMAQCGYGTSAQDCQHQQRDARAAEEAQQHYQRELEAQGNNQTGYDAGPSPSGPPRTVYGYVAVAWHGDAADVWATWNQPTEEIATTFALHACKLSMGEGCSIALSAWNSTIAVAKAPDGGLKVGWGAKPDEATRQAMQACSSEQAGCTIQHRFTAAPFALAKDHNPRNPPRVSYAMIAWPKSAPAPMWRGKIWIISGKGGYEESRALLLDRCKRDTGIECQIPHWARGDTGTKNGGVIARYNNPNHGVMWFASASLNDAKKAMNAGCAKENVICDSLMTYDTFLPRLQTLG